MASWKMLATNERTSKYESTSQPTLFIATEKFTSAEHSKMVIMQLPGLVTIIPLSGFSPSYSYGLPPALLFPMPLIPKIPRP